MGVSIARLASCAAGLALMLASAACQGNIGTGGGLPQPPGPQVTPIAGAQSRTRTTEGAVFLESDVKTIPLPEVGGFSVTIALELPAPAPSGALSGAEALTAGSGKPQAGPPVTPPSASAAPAAKGSGAPANAASGGPSSKPTSHSALAANEKPKTTATPSGPKIDTKTTIYPEDVPAAPTPQPTGNVQAYAHRTPLVRGWIFSRVPLTLYSLAAARFTIPTQEQTKGRGYTIALFESLKHRKTRLIAWDAAAVVADNSISAASVATEPIPLKKSMGYYFVLYGDDLGPLPTPTGSFPAANNPLLGSPGPGTLLVTPIPGLTPFPASTPVTIPH